ncbi:3',5'-cyclic-nucleotide phosphodiesterase [Methanosarcina sp. MTP4]|uniref:metallophosphoesterase n=1 Tax=Methanosarcina sp. MTP4 TaxID=1434100 RepID=UPI0006160BA8|nr:metallophosphoesterase [Methanosarcina sp. MTP4]AKB23551.1 3',5'-cyclic-nucleotide phosphodiesterase [Methanosarcina sp. MTP4]
MKINQTEESDIMLIVHLSDIHFSEAYYLPEIADAMIESINRYSPDIVVITGDLTENGLFAMSGSKGCLQGRKRTGCGYDNLSKLRDYRMYRYS